MSEFKSLDDVTGYLMSVAEFELKHTEHVEIPNGHMTVVNENYQAMYDVINWIVEKVKQPTLNENQQIVLDELQDKYDSKVPSLGIYELVAYSHGESGDAYEALTSKEEAQVLQVFSAWVKEQEAGND